MGSGRGCLWLPAPDASMPPSSSNTAPKSGSKPVRSACTGSHRAPAGCWAAEPASREGQCSPSVVQSTLQDGQLTLDAVQRLCHWQSARIARLPR